MNYEVHPTAIVDPGAHIGSGTKIWHFSHICTTARIGQNCNLGQNVYVDNHAVVGNNCKLQNNVNVYYGVALEDYVFCGPSMTFTNVKIPRCKYPRDPQGDHYLHTIVRQGATLGAHCVVVCGVTIGKHAFVGAGAVVTKDVPDYGVMVGNPARQLGWACACGEMLKNNNLVCTGCGRVYQFDDGGWLNLLESQVSKTSPTTDMESNVNSGGGGALSRRLKEEAWHLLKYIWLWKWVAVC